jgi:hypothetical protein
VTSSDFHCFRGPALFFFFFESMDLRATSKLPTKTHGRDDPPDGYILGVDVLRYGGLVGIGIAIGDYGIGCSEELAMVGTVRPFS